MPAAPTKVRGTKVTRTTEITMERFRRRPLPISPRIKASLTAGPPARGLFPHRSRPSFAGTLRHRNHRSVEGLCLITDHDSVPELYHALAHLVHNVVVVRCHDHSRAVLVD